MISVSLARRRLNRETEEGKINRIKVERDYTTRKIKKMMQISRIQKMKIKKKRKMNKTNLFISNTWHWLRTS